LLAATLLLCLSNLLFLPAVGLAVYRGFYTESFVYFAAMVFSTVSVNKKKYSSGEIFALSRSLAYPTNKFWLEFY